MRKPNNILTFICPSNSNVQLIPPHISEFIDFVALPIRLPADICPIALRLCKYRRTVIAVICWNIIYRTPVNWFTMWINLSLMAHCLPKVCEHDALCWHCDLNVVALLSDMLLISWMTTCCPLDDCTE
jgi:hypothetical protein